MPAQPPRPVHIHPRGTYPLSDSHKLTHTGLEASAKQAELSALQGRGFITWIFHFLSYYCSRRKRSNPQRRARHLKAVCSCPLSSPIFSLHLIQLRANGHPVGGSVVVDCWPSCNFCLKGKKNGFKKRGNCSSLESGSRACM